MTRTLAAKSSGFPRVVGGTINIGAFEVQSGTTNQPSSFSISGFPVSVTSGSARTFTVTARDADGTIDANYTGTVQFTSSDRKAKLPADYIFTAADAAVHTFSATLKTAGTQSLTVADTTTVSLTGMEGSITVHPAAASKFLLSARAGVSAGVSFSMTVTVEDAYGNVVTGYAGTAHFSSSDKSAKLPANYSFSACDAGVHTFTGLVLYTKGRQKISVTAVHNSALTGSDSISVG